jgi:hypothetical protein
MKRLPNLWVFLPVVLAAAAGGAIGFFVTDASCAPDSCPVAAGIIGVIVAVGTGVGVGIVVVLALKSLSEWRDHADRGILTASDQTEPPGPPTC